MTLTHRNTFSISQQHIFCTLISNEGVIVPLKNIESIVTITEENATDRENFLVNKLKDDIIICITTLSGATHYVSINETRKRFAKNSRVDVLTAMEFLEDIVIKNWLESIGAF